MTEKSISVIIPTHNRVALVTRAIESVVRQSYPVSEIIIVDDGSTDETETLLATKPPPVKYLRIPHSGVSAARNHGIRAASGDWIAFLDSDDTWLPTKIERQIAAVDRYHAVVSYTGAVADTGETFGIDETGAAPMKPGEIQYFDDPSPVVFKSHAHPLLPTLLVSRSTLDAVGLFDESLVVAEDTKLIYNLAFQRGLCYINEPLVRIARSRKGPGLSDNIASDFAARRYECYLRVQSEAYWRLLVIDPAAAARIRKNLGYFISRRAEIACARDEIALCRTLSRSGLFYRDGLVTFSRCLALYFAPFLFRQRFRRKWKSASGRYTAA